MKKFLALVLAVLMAFSLCSVAMAASDTPMTAAFLSELSKSKQFYAHVTGHTYENHSDSTNFDIYDDFNTNKISCNFKSKGIRAIYDNGEVKCVFTPLFCYVSASAASVPLLGTAVLAVEAFQTVLKKFIDDPMLNSFTCTISTVERNGQTVTCEKFTGKLIQVSGSFYYNSDGKLCEIVLTDTVGASIGFTVENVATSFDGDVFSVPFYYINLSVIWKILMLFISLLG